MYQRNLKMLRSIVLFFIYIIIVNTADAAVYKFKYIHNEKFIPNLSQNEVNEKDKYYPLKDFNKFPEKMRRLFQREKYEYDVCRNNPQENAQQEGRVLQHCNTQQRLLFLIKKHGWYWGGSDTSADQRWIYCGHCIRFWRHSHYEGDIFSAAEIRADLEEGHTVHR